MVNKQKAAGFAGLLIALAMSSQAIAAPVLDQSNTPGPVFYNPLGPTFVPGENTAEVAQTFTVGAAGQLTSISVDLLVFDSNMTMSIVTVNAGVPDTVSAPLAAVSQTLSSATPQFFVFDFTSADIRVNPGDQLAFWLTGDFSRWTNSSSDSYAGGAAYWRFPGAIDGAPTDWTNTNTDAYFQTFVDTAIPEPSTFLFLGSGIAALGLRRRRKA